jgi:hypothetical protein
MNTKKICSIILGFIGIFLFIPYAQAQQPIDIIVCGSGTVTTIVASEEITIMSSEARGISIDNLPSRIFDNMTYHLVALLTITGGKLTGYFYAKYMDPSGDFFVVEGPQVGLEYNWKFLYGTGKWKGITGGGKGMVVTKGRPISPGTTQVCARITGTYELPK